MWILVLQFMMIQMKEIFTRTHFRMIQLNDSSWHPGIVYTRMPRRIGTSDQNQLSEPPRNPTQFRTTAHVIDTRGPLLAGPNSCFVVVSSGCAGATPRRRPRALSSTSPGVLERSLAASTPSLQPAALHEGGESRRVLDSLTSVERSYLRLIYSPYGIYYTLFGIFGIVCVIACDKSCRATPRSTVERRW